MNIDLITWLRAEADAAAHQPPPWKMLAVAADEIERLHREIESSRIALMQAKNHNVRLLSQLQEYEAREQ